MWSVAEDGMQNHDTGTKEQPISKSGMRDGRTSVSAIAELNKMDGHHAATNHNLNVTSVSFTQSIGQQSQTEKPVSDQ